MRVNESKAKTGHKSKSVSDCATENDGRIMRTLKDKMRNWSVNTATLQYNWGEKINSLLQVIVKNYKINW